MSSDDALTPPSENRPADQTESPQATEAETATETEATATGDTAVQAAPAAESAPTPEPTGSPVAEEGVAPPAGEATGETLADSSAELPADAQTTPIETPAPEAAAISTDNTVAAELNQTEAAPEATDVAIDSASDIATTPPTGDQPSEGTLTPESAAETILEEATESKPKPRLNPQGSGGAKAVPQFSGAIEGEPKGGPVEIPKDVALDSDMEAEIEAAMAGATQAPAAPQAPAEAASTAADGSADEAQAEENPYATLEEYPTEESLTDGLRLKGKVQAVHGDNVFLDLGYTSAGIAPLRQFSKPPEEGQDVDVVFAKFEENDKLIHVNLPRGPRKVSGGEWTSLSKNQVVDVMVNKTNKGGLEVQVGSLRGFMPASQADLGYTEDLEQFVGQKLRAMVTEVNPRRKNLIVSRRAFLMIEREEAESMIWTKLEEGQTYDGTVKTIKDYGAFVDIGGVDGFLHISDISWNRIRHPSDVIAQGDQVSVKVTNVDREKKRIGLSLKALTDNPWANIEDKYPKDSRVEGTVTKVTDFGAFVELEPSVEGLCHISQLAHRRVHKVTEILKVGESYEFLVTEVLPQKRRISLSIKALTPAPTRQDNRRRKEEELPEAERYERKRKGPLKGGTGDESGGGLFGNPGDFGSN